MPWWKRSSPEEEQLRVQAQQEAVASLHSLQADGLPARSLAMDRLVAMARSFHAVGVVGMHIGFNKGENEYEREHDTTTYRDLFINFSAVGTAIVSRRPDHVVPSPTPTLAFTDLRSGRSDETRELTIRE